MFLFLRSALTVIYQSICHESSNNNLQWQHGSGADHSYLEKMDKCGKSIMRWILYLHGSRNEEHGEEEGYGSRRFGRRFGVSIGGIDEGERNGCGVDQGVVTERNVVREGGWTDIYDIFTLEICKRSSQKVPFAIHG